MCCSKWEKQLLQGILGKFKRQQPDFSIISKTIFGEDPLRHAVNSQPTWTEEGKEGSLTYMKCVFSRQTICGKERKKEREEEGWGVGGGGVGDEGCICDITEKVFHTSSAYEHSSHWLMAGRQRETSELPHTWRPSHMLIIAVVIRPLSLMNGCQGEHLLHMWACLVVWKIHMLLMKGNLRFWQVSGAMSAVKRNEWPKWNRSRKVKIDWRINRKLKKHMGEKHGHRYSVLYITACVN